MNINKAIIPATSLGGFNIGYSISEYSDYLMRNNIVGNLTYTQVGIYSTLYTVNSLPIEVYVDTRDGRIYKISAIKGYQGTYNNLIEVGMSTKAVFELGNHFYYDECDQGILSTEIEGIIFEPDDEDPYPEEVPTLNIGAITIFNPEVFKPPKTI